MSRRSTIGWVVDAQVDFMDPSGRLYVKDLGDDTDVGSAQIADAIRRAVDWMNAKCAVVVFTGDWHGMEDEEIDPLAPDPAAGTYPPHCMGRSDDPDEREGAEIIPEVRPDDPLVLAYDATPEDAVAIARSAVAEARPVFIQKTRFDVFTGNPVTEDFLKALEVSLGTELDFVVVGVARDVCVTQAIDGLQERAYRVTALTDATWGLGLEPEHTTLARWAERGRLATLDELVAD